MKTVRYLRMWSVFCALISTKLILAQSPCTFTLSSANVTAGTVNFTISAPTTTPATMNLWNFGNGTYVTSTATTQSATYLSDGTYYVIVTNTLNPSCTGDTITLNITGVGCNLNPSFTTFTQPTVNITSFNNTSTGMTSVATCTWSFGDGTSATGMNANHNYATNGTYVATLTVDNNSTPACVMSQTALVTINTPTCNLSLSYSVGASGATSFTANAIGNSTATPGNFNWSFGTFTGFQYGTNAQPTFTYTSDGVYVVNVTYLSYQYTCTSTLTQSVVVNTAGCNLNAIFSTSTQTLNMTFFNNLSTGISAISSATWDYGDGSSPFVEAPPGNSVNHSYANSGNYVVTLTETNNTIPPCTDTQTLLVNVPYGAPCVANAGFTMTPSGTPQVWNATPNAPANIASATWLWGDGSSSNTLYTSHTYSAAGTYSICLVATAYCGDIDTSCFSYAIYRTMNVNQDLNVIRVDVIDPSAPTGIKAVSAESAEFSILPNPNSGTFNLKLSKLAGASAKITVYDLVGKQVYEGEAEGSNGSFTKAIQLDNAANGVYVIRIATDAKVLTKKMVINRQ